MSDAQANLLLDLYFSKASNTTVPATLYVALSTTTPTNTGANVTEPVGNSYARVSVTNNATNFPAAAARAKSNGTDIVFPMATGSWGTITHFAIYDASTAGNFIAWGALTVPVSVINGATVTFVTGSLIINAPGA
jgi:predicted enzyme related to lactoylglutathione lyase